MGSDAPFVRAARGNHHPLGHIRRAPAEWLGDHRCEAPPAARHGQEVVDISELPFQLDQQQRPRGGVPGDEINHAALAEVTERHFGPHIPSGSDEHLADRLRHRGMSLCEESIQPSTAPPWLEDESDLQDLADLPQRAEAAASDVATLDAPIRAR